MFKTSGKDTSPPAAATTANSPSTLSSKAGKLKKTPEGGLRLEGDSGVLGKGNKSSSQPEEKQRFFATRSSDGQWNLLMAPTSDPSRLFLVQPAPGHNFQVAGSGVGMESASCASDKSDSSSTNSTSAPSGCPQQQAAKASGVQSPTGATPGTSKTIVVPVAQSRMSSTISPVSSACTAVASTPTDIYTKTFNTKALPSTTLPDQKKPCFFRSRSARHREALKVSSAQHALGKKVLSGPRRASKSVVSSSTDGSKKGKMEKTSGHFRTQGRLASPQQVSKSPNLSAASVSEANLKTTSTIMTATTTAVALDVRSTVSSPLVTSHSSLTASPCVASPLSLASPSPSSSVIPNPSVISPPSSPLSPPASPSAAVSHFDLCTSVAGDGAASFSSGKSDEAQSCENVFNDIDKDAENLDVKSDDSCRELLQYQRKSSANENKRSVNAAECVDKDSETSYQPRYKRKQSLVGLEDNSQLCPCQELNSQTDVNNVNVNNRNAAVSEGQHGEGFHDFQSLSSTSHENDSGGFSAEEVLEFMEPEMLCGMNENVCLSGSQGKEGVDEQGVVDKTGTVSDSASDTDDYEFIISDSEKDQISHSKGTKGGESERQESCVLGSEQDTVTELINQHKTKKVLDCQKVANSCQHSTNTEGNEDHVVASSMPQRRNRKRGLNSTTDSTPNPRHSVFSNDKSNESGGLKLVQEVDATAVCSMSSDPVVRKEISYEIDCFTHGLEGQSNLPPVPTVSDIAKPTQSNRSELSTGKQSTCFGVSKKKPRKKRKSEVEALMETQETEQVDLDDVAEVDNFGTQSKCLQGSSIFEEAPSTATDEMLILHPPKKRKKKKRKRKLTIHIGSDVPKPDEKIDASCIDIPAASAHIPNSGPEEDRSTPVINEPPGTLEQCVNENSTISESNTHQDSRHSEQTEENKAVGVQSSSDQKAFRKKQKKKKKKKFVSESPVSGFSSNTKPEKEADRHKTLSESVPASEYPLATEHECSNVSDTGQSFISPTSFNMPPKKVRKKRPTELETLIHDQRLLVPDGSKDGKEVKSASEIDYIDSGNDNKETESDTDKTEEDVEGSTADSTDIEIKSTAESENAAESINLVSHVSSKNLTEKGAQGEVKKLSFKTKKKGKKGPSAGIIQMPPAMPGTESSIDLTFDTNMSSENTPSSSHIQVNDLKGSDINASLVILTDNEDDEEVKANKAMDKFLKSRCFSRWELAGMFGTPFIVLERLSDKDIFFMSRRFRNARLSSRSRCSDYCRQRNLNYLCKLKLIDCRPPPGTKKIVPDWMVTKSDELALLGEPPKKKRKKHNKDKEKKKENVHGGEKMKRKDGAKEVDKAPPKDVILPSVSRKTVSLLASTSPTISLLNSMSTLPSSSTSAGHVVRRATVTKQPSSILVPVPPPTTPTTLPHFFIPSLSTGAIRPQVITIPPMGGTSSVQSAVLIPSLMCGTRTATTPTVSVSSSFSLREATRASLTKAISNSLSLRNVLPNTTKSSPAMTSCSVNSALISALSAPVTRTGSVQTPVTASASSQSHPKQFFVVQMGDKRMLVPATALSTTSSTPTLTSPVLASPVTCSIASSSGLTIQSQINSALSTAQRLPGTAISTIRPAASATRLSTPISLVPGSMARIVLSQRRVTTAGLSAGDSTTSTSSVSSQLRVARPNRPWVGPHTVDSNSRVMVSPTTQPQSIRVVLSNAGGVSPSTRFTVASSRGGVFLASRQPTSLIRMAAPSHARPGKRVMTEEERLRKRARLEKKYPLPPGVVIKTEPVIQGYGGEGKTTQAASGSTHVIVSSVPLGANSRNQIGQPIPVMPAMPGTPIIIRQAPGTAASKRTGSSLLRPLIIRVPNTVTAATPCATSVHRLAMAAASTVSSHSLVSSTAGPASTSTSSAAPVTVSLLNNRIRVAATSLSAAARPSTHVARVVAPPVSQSRSLPVSSESVTHSVSTESISLVDDDAIYIVDSPSPQPAPRDERNCQLTDCVAVASPASASGSVREGDLADSRDSVSSLTTVPLSTTSNPAPVTSATSSASSPTPGPCLAPVTSASSHLASLGAMWVRQVADSPGNVPNIDARSLQTERMKRLKETLAKQMENIGDERRQKALQALHMQFCQIESTDSQNDAQGDSSAQSNQNYTQQENENRSEIDNSFADRPGASSADGGSVGIECSVADAISKDSSVRPDSQVKEVQKEQSTLNSGDTSAQKGDQEKILESARENPICIDLVGSQENTSSLLQGTEESVAVSGAKGTGDRSEFAGHLSEGSVAGNDRNNCARTDVLDVADFVVTLDGGDHEIVPEVNTSRQDTQNTEDVCAEVINSE